MNNLDPCLTNYVFECVGSYNHKGYNFIQVTLKSLLGAKIELCFDSYDKSTKFITIIETKYNNINEIFETYNEIMLK